MNKRNLKQHNLFLQSQLASNFGFNPQKSLNFNHTMYNNLITARDRAVNSNKYIWTGLNKFTNVNSQQLECLLYDFGSLAFNPVTLTWTRFAKQGKLNSLGQLSQVKPIGLDGRQYDTMFGVLDGNNDTPIDKNVCIVLHDYTGIVSTDNIISRATLNKTTTIKDQTDTYRQLYFTILLSTKKILAVCDNASQVKAVYEQAERMLNPEDPIIAFVKGLSDDNNNLFEPFGQNFMPDLQSYITAIDFYDRTRNQYNGFATEPVKQKAERMITAELDNMTEIVDFVLQDGLVQRQTFCELLKKYTDIQLSVTTYKDTKEQNDKINATANNEVQADNTIV